MSVNIPYYELYIYIHIHMYMYPLASNHAKYVKKMLLLLWQEVLEPNKAAF